MRSKFLLFALFVFALLITQTAFAQSQCVLPHVANGLFPGGSFRTTFLIVNNTDSTATAVLDLTKDNGEPLQVTIPGLRNPQSKFTLTLMPGAVRILQTDGSGSLVSGAATVTSDAPLGASAIFTVLDPNGNFLSEVGMGDSPALSQFTFPVQVSRTLDTGIALYNPSSSAVILSLRLLDWDGAVVSSTQLTLPPKNHVARLASELFRITTDIGGSIAVTGTDKIAALVLRQNTSAGTPAYTNLPVTSGASQLTLEGTMIGTTPTQVNGLTGVVAVTKGAVLKSDQTVTALRATEDPDDMTKMVSLTPTQINGLTGVAALSGSLALKSDGTVWDIYGPSPSPVGLSDVVALHQTILGDGLALKRDGSIWWWIPEFPGVVHELSETKEVVAVAAMDLQGLALKENGTVWVGYYFGGWVQLGGIDGIVAIDAGYATALALKSDGTVWDISKGTPTQVQGIAGVAGISADDHHCLALARDGTVWEWEPSYSGSGVPPTPRQVTGLTGVVQVAAAWYHSLALLSDGTVWAWRHQ